MYGYETLDISGDAGIRAFGTTLEELFINAAVGMYGLMIDTSSVAEVETVDIAVESSSLEGLLVSFLNELIFRFDAYGFSGKRIVIASIDSHGQVDDGEETFSLAASVSGEAFDPARHEGKLLIKAATYHNLGLKKRDGQWVVEVIFDI